MSITFPLELPASARVRGSPRLLDPRDALAPTRGGYPSGINMAVPLWKISYETAALTRAQLLEWEAFFLALNGSLGFFKAIHPGRRYPVGRRRGYAGEVVAGSSDPFDGTGTIDNVDLTLARVRLNGLPNTAGFEPGLAPGDAVSIAHTSQGRGLYIVNAAATSNSDGRCTLVDLRPALTPRVADGAAYSIVAPWFEAQLDPGSLSIVDTKDERRVSFSATQVIR